MSHAYQFGEALYFGYLLFYSKSCKQIWLKSIHGKKLQFFCQEGSQLFQGEFSDSVKSVVWILSDPIDDITIVYFVLKITVFAEGHISKRIDAQITQ